MAARINPDHDLLTGFPARETGKRQLEARNLVHVFGEGALRARALRGVSLALEGGNPTLLIGPSGSGKTTLLSILGCILTPTEGMVFVGGEAATGMPAERLALFRRHHIRYVFQSYNLFPTLTAEENMRVALDVRWLKRSGVAVASQKALQTVGMIHKAKSFPRDLSGGEQQRVAVARALVGAPSVILADEPTAALDSKHGMGVMGLLKQLASEPNRAVLAGTHDPRAVPFADRVLHIGDGMIINEQKRPQGIATVNDFSFAKSQRMPDAPPIKFPTVNAERECRLEIIRAHLRKHAPDCEVAQRRSKVLTRNCTVGRICFRYLPSGIILTTRLSRKATAASQVWLRCLRTDQARSGESRGEHQSAWSHLLTARRNQAGPLRSLTLRAQASCTVTAGWLRNDKYASAGG